MPSPSPKAASHGPLQAKVIYFHVPSPCLRFMTSLGLQSEQRLHMPTYIEEVRRILAGPAADPGPGTGTTSGIGPTDLREASPLLEDAQPKGMGFGDSGWPQRNVVKSENTNTSNVWHSFPICCPY